MTQRTLATLTCLLSLTLTGCHHECGTMNPFWLDAECESSAGYNPGDSGLTECDIMLEISVDGASEATAAAGEVVELVANIVNVSGFSQTFTIENPCPDGLVVFEGLGDGVDYYVSCLADECPEAGEPVSYTLAPGETLPVDATINTDGDDCSTPLDSGTYTVSGSLPLTTDPQPMVCALPARLTISE